MSIFSDIDNLFKVPYQGYQYPVPPWWKRVVSLQDEIELLLQCILILNQNGTSEEWVDGVVEKALAEAKKYTDAETEARESADSEERKERIAGDDYLAAVIALLNQRVTEITSGLWVYHNPITGDLCYPYTVARQVREANAPYMATHGDYNYLASELGVTYYEVQNAKQSAYAFEALGVTVTPCEPNSDGRVFVGNDAATEITNLLFEQFSGILARHFASEMGGVVTDCVRASVTPSAGIPDVGAGFEVSPYIFTKYNEIDEYGVLGYKGHID